MPPGDTSKYESIYTSNANSRTGLLTFPSLQPLYDSLDVPDTDLRSAWNLVNPASEQAIGKHASLAFLHILNMRHEGYRIPRSVPASLRATFDQGTIDYNVESDSGGVRAKSGRRYNADADGDTNKNNNNNNTSANENTSTSRKAKFGDAYLSRLGGRTSAGGYNPTGTDFSQTTARTDGEWEEIRLKRQLANLEDRINKVESDATTDSTSSRRTNNKNSTRNGGGSRREDTSKPALVKRELESLLDYKRREIRDLESGEGRAKSGEVVKGMEKEIADVREMVDGLERHMRGREEVLEGLRREVEGERRR